MNEIINNLLTYTLPGMAGSGILASIFLRRRTSAETKGIELDNADKVRDGYESLIESLKQDRIRLMEEYDRRIADLEEFYTRKMELMKQTWDMEKITFSARISQLELEIKKLKNI